MARAETLITQQRAGQIAVHSATARRLELRRALQVTLLRYLIRVGEAAAKVKPELALQFELPSLTTPRKSFLSSVKAMLQLAETEREFLLSVGLSELALTDLKREVTEYEGTIETANSGRSAHIGATADLDAVSAEIMNLVRILDGLNRYRFRDDSELLAAWSNASRLPVRVRSPEAEPAEGGAVTPPAGGGLAPAA